MAKGEPELEPIISDGNYDYFNHKVEDYKGIVLSTINRIQAISSNQLSKTGKIHVKVGNDWLTKEENTLKIYYQLVDFLEDLLLYTFDDEVKLIISKQNEYRKKIYKKYFDIYVNAQTNAQRKYQIARMGIIPNDNNDGLALWCNEQIDEEITQTYRNKLRALLLLFKRKNELSNKRIATMGL